MGERGQPLKIAAAIVGLLAGVVTVIYVVGGLVIALRLFFDHFQQDEVINAVGQLPRETLVAAALLGVFGLAAVVGLFAALLAALAGYLADRWRSHRAARDEEASGGGRPLWLKALRVGGYLAAFVALPLLASLPALLHAIGQEETGRGWIVYVGGVVLTLGAVFGGRYLFLRARGRGWPRAGWALAIGAICAGVAVIPLLAIAGTRPFVSAQVCTSGETVPVKGKLVGEGSSRVFLEEEFGNEAAIRVLPASQVTRSEYGDLSAAFACPLPPGRERQAEVAERRLGGHGSEAEVELATALRPRLLLDSRERWRPLEVEAFLAEDFGRGEGHRLCRRRCQPAAGAGPLRRGFGSPDYIDIGGRAENGDDAKAADPSCHTERPLSYDCNSGPAAAIYYRRTTREGRWYWDYWWFLRYSDYSGPLDDCNPVNCSDHEGDWEGVTVITAPTAPRETAAAEEPTSPPEILGAIYAAHRNRVLVDAGMVPLSGGRPLVFVAAGTHASYPYRCRIACRQYARLADSVRLPETPHDGAVAWGGNDDGRCQRDRCVRPLPEVEAADDLALPLAGAWAGWPGLWGETCHAGCEWPLLQGSPRSPGLQIRYECPWAATDRAKPEPDGSGLSRAERVGDAERVFAACRAQRGGERGLWSVEPVERPAP